MKGTTLAIQWIIRLTGLIQLGLGIPIWTGNFDNLIAVHTLDGLLFVAALIVTAVLAAIARVRPGLVAVGLVWAVVVVVLGLTQQRLLPGPAHWIVQVIHLLVGVSAIGLGETLARRTHARLGTVAVAK